MLQASFVLSSDFVEVLSLLVFDEGLSFNLHQVRSVLLQYLQRCKVEACESYYQAQFIGNSMQSCCAFLLQSDDMVRLHVHQCVAY